MASRHESVLSASSFVSSYDGTSSLEFCPESQVRNVVIAIEKMLANKGKSAAILWRPAAWGSRAATVSTCRIAAVAYTVRTSRRRGHRPQRP